MTTELTTEQKIKVLHEVAGLIEGSVVKEYAGRGIYGRTCFGMESDDCQTAIEEAAKRGVEGTARDSLGKGRVVYWPTVTKETAKFL